MYNRWGVCVHMCMCMVGCLCVHMCMCMCGWGVYVCICVCACVGGVIVCMCVCAWWGVYVCICIWWGDYVCICVCACVYIKTLYCRALCAAVHASQSTTKPSIYACTWLSWKLLEKDPAYTHMLTMILPPTSLGYVLHMEEKKQWERTM